MREPETTCPKVIDDGENGYCEDCEACEHDRKAADIYWRWYFGASIKDAKSDTQYREEMIDAGRGRLLGDR